MNGSIPLGGPFSREGFAIRGFARCFAIQRISFENRLVLDGHGLPVPLEDSHEG